MVRSTLEEWTARENGDRGTLLRVRAMNHMAMAATTVATTAPPTASAWLVQRPPSRDRTRMPRRFPTAWQAAATRKNTTTAVSSRRTELSSETSSPAWVAAHAPRARPTSSPRYPMSTIANPRRQPLRAARARITSRRMSIACRWKGIAVPAAEGVHLILIGWRTKHGGFTRRGRVPMHTTYGHRRRHRAGTAVAGRRPGPVPGPAGRGRVLGGRAHARRDGQGLRAAEGDQPGAVRRAPGGAVRPRGLLRPGIRGSRPGSARPARPACARRSGPGPRPARTAARTTGPY